MRYLILKKSHALLFLADRNKTKKFWWTYSLAFAMKFVSRDVALEKAKALKYGEFKVITEDEAKQLRKQKDIEHQKEIEEYVELDYRTYEDDHPFDLGDYGSR